MSSKGQRLYEEPLQDRLAAECVLSVDDDEGVRYIRRRILEGAGFCVLEAADGPEALRLAESAQPSLVLLDIHLPHQDGFAVCERLKLNRKTSAIPVVHISAMGSLEADMPESLRRHSDAYLREPVDPQTLVAVVQALIRARRSERQLLDTEEKYRHVVETALEAIWVVDPDATIRFVNNRMAEMLQYPPEELVGARIWDLAPEGDEERLKALAMERIGLDAKDRVDLALRRRDGSVIWLSGAGKTTYNDSGQPVLRTGLFIDITDRKQAQDALHESHERLQLALDVAELGSWEMDLRTGAISASPLVCGMFDFDSAHPQVEEWIGRMHPADREQVRSAMEAAKGGTPYDIEFRVIAANGGMRWVHSRARRVHDSRGHMTRLVGVAQDITRRVEASAARERQRELFQAIIEHIPVMLSIYDRQLHTFQFNREMEQILGWTTEDAMDGDMASKFYPDPAVRAEAMGYMFALTPGWREFPTTAKDGTAIPCEWANIALSDDRLLGIGIDLRERKRAQESLRESEAQLRARAAELQAIMDALPVAMFVARDPGCREVVGSRLTYELLRLGEGANVSPSAWKKGGGRAFRFVRDGREIPERQWPAQRAVATGAAVRDYEFDIVYDDGSRRNMLGHAVPLFDDKSRPSGAVAAFLDITDRKQAEEQLRKSQKLESLGLLAGGIAHDFNNLLTAIMGNTSIVMEEVGPGASKRLKSILRSGERAAGLIRQLLAYTGKGEFVVRDVDVAQAVSDMRGLMELSVPKSVRLHLDLEQRLPLLRVDAGQLEQVVMNLVINAGEAIGEGNPGEIHVSASTVTVEEAFTDALGSETEPGRYVQIEVSDTGSGIDRSTMSRLFDPFFTTKFSGRGLGLSAVAGIVRSHRGAITVDGEKRKGTRFRVLLPVGCCSGERNEEPAGAPDKVVLVVDDEEPVREFIAEVARRRGFDVLTACDGEEALSICERRRVDAAVLDVIMPVMGANVLLPKLKQRQPNARILLTSGYNETDARQLCAAYPDTAFLPKPYTSEQIGNAIAALLQK